MSSLLPQVLAGLATGGIYASVALALVMIYQATNHVNFAQGEMAMFSTFLAWALIQNGMPYWLAFVVTLALSFVIAAVIEFVVIRPMHNAPVLSIVVVFVGLLVVFHSLAGLLFGYTIKEFPSPFPAEAWYGSSLMSAHDVGAIGVTLIMVTALFCFFRFTPLGLVMRAAAQNAASSRLVGINVSRMLMLGWGLAGAVGAVAGMMVAPVVFLDPDMMTGVLLYAFAGALVGGIDNPFGAVVGGFLVGILENVVGTYIVGTELKLTVALAMIIGVLIVRPSGLMGRTIVTRV
ncbi:MULTISPECIES: branched-chain amino acid ABC transporter permease [unclassified Beijerinckia]|uniref:branched-chain amino acid ABC transporter permease n=1 Tax=unclassified Beijerinckia TaxID=2638183 RepID=UPI000897F0B8|nr:MULTISPECIES: branched-chain amino acid ABC transporter permease [unclassified Beijerinckia]MDH7799180.1 branched-chain amino acid transport system permease protein [Beijerinckia sp. GAS462]SED92771.1 amino acid/amide ABC transporter membrane protein 1, HAAT family [Beijerinckia sp. 28-YEA-48]